MLNVTIVGERQLIQRLTALGPALRVDLRKVVFNLTLDLQKKVITEKLHGQVLHQRSGNLVRSIQQRIEESGATIYGFVYSAGDVKYAAHWEFGFNGTVTVRAHSRLVSQIFGREVDPFVQGVREHSRTVHDAARPFLRPSLEEMAPRIVRDIKDTVLASMRRQVMGNRA